MAAVNDFRSGTYESGRGTIAGWGRGRHATVSQLMSSGCFSGGGSWKWAEVAWKVGGYS